jgi:hypothetical protein
MKTDLGYYSVNGVSFATNKVMAVLEAQKTNAEVVWNYFDDVFKKTDWLTEPTMSLDELYRIRAQQIRDAYDYVVIFVSGGADSTNVVRTFINNNIHIDEVIAAIPESGLKNFEWDDKDFAAGNVMSETKFAQYPILHEIATKTPTTKITVHDFFTDIVDMESDKWIYQSEGDLIGMSGYNYGRMDSFPHLKDLAEQGKRIASVWGTDKPVLMVTSTGDIYTMIADSAVYLPKYPFKTVYPNVNRVLFYWTHELPELMVKQSHVVAREIIKPENKFIFQAAIDQAKKSQEVNPLGLDDILANIFKTSADTTSYSPKTVYQRGIVPFIYPTTYDSTVFQSRKFDQVQTFLPAFNNWITELHGNSRIGQMIVSDFSLFYKNISPKYLNPNKTGFNMCLKRFCIGNYKDFITSNKV